MKKIAVIGCGGAGKSTLSRKLSEKLNIPVYHLDRLFWKPGWVQTPKEEWDELQKTLISKEEWIIDGNYGGTMELRLESADTVIFLNMPTHVCLHRVLKRRILYHGKTRPDMNNGCVEKLDFEFIKWVWNYNKNRRPGILDKLNSLSQEKRVIILNSPSEVENLIREL